METSHRCGFAYCINPTHLATESHTNNMKRGKCFARARLHAEKGMKIRKHCAVHSQPCLLQLACEPSTGKIITEYESLGKPAVQDMPPQTKSTKGPALLATDIRIFSWVDNVRVLDGEITCPRSNQVFSTASHRLSNVAH